MPRRKRTVEPIVPRPKEPKGRERHRPIMFYPEDAFRAEFDRFCVDRGIAYSDAVAWAVSRMIAEDWNLTPPRSGTEG